MASVVYNSAKNAILTAYLATLDARAKLLMSNTTAGTQNDGVVNVADITTLDLCDATGYADQTLAGEAVATDDANDRAEYDATDIVFSGLGGDASRNYVGVLIIDYVDGTNANDIVAFYIEFSAARDAAATSVTVPWNTEGILWAS